MKKFFTKQYLKELFIVTIGNLLVAIAFSFFLDPINLVIGGATGLATIFKDQFGWDTAISVFIINTILLLLGFAVLGKDFFVKTLYSTLILPVFISICNYAYGFMTVGKEILVNDRMLVILFSSIIMGLGIGLVMKNGGTTGGTEVPQKMLYKFFHMPFSVSLFLIDGVIVLIGALLIKSETVTTGIDYTMILYAVLFIYLSGLVMDQIVFSGFNSRAVYIISEKNEEIKKQILDDFERGVTQIKVVGGWTNTEKTKLVCVLSSNEFYKLKGIVHEIDPNAFFYAVRASEVFGEGFTHNHEGN